MKLNVGSLQEKTQTYTSRSHTVKESIVDEGDSLKRFQMGASYYGRKKDHDHLH